MRLIILGFNHYDIKIEYFNLNIKIFYIKIIKGFGVLGNGVYKSLLNQKNESRHLDIQGFKKQEIYVSKTFSDVRILLRAYRLTNT